MKRILLLSLLVLVAACSPQPAVICNTPYILVGTTCCLDQDGNGACDAHEGGGAPSECPALDCSTCPAEVVERTVTETLSKYVCAKDLREVDAPEDCLPKGTRASDYKPITTNEEGTVIDEFSVRAACRDSYNAVEVHYVVGASSPRVVLQVKDAPTAAWKDVLEVTGGAQESYQYGAFCQGSCTNNAQFYLEPGRAYLMRARFDYNSLYGQFQYSNEHILDATDEGEMITKLC